MSIGWKYQNLKDVSHIMYGHTDKASSEIDGPKYLRITDIQNNNVDWNSVPQCPPLGKEFDKYKLKPGDIVFARTGATTGKSFLIRENVNAVFASYLIRVQINTKEIIPEFLLLYFQSPAYWELIQDGISGSAQGGFNASKLGELRIPIPSPKEQKQIVAIIDEAFAAIDKAKSNIEKNIENAKELFQAKLCEVFDSNDSKSWPTSRLIEVCTIKPPKKEASENLDENSLVSFVPMNDLGIDEMFFETKDSKPLKEVQSSYTYFADGDVLLAKITPCFENGKLGIAKNLINGVGFGSSEFVVYRPDKAILSEWLYYFLCQDKFRTEGASRMTGAVGHKRIPKDFYEDALIVLPDIKLQRKIIGNLNQLRANLKFVHNKYENKIQTLSELKKSILQRAFAGELIKEIA